MAEWNCPTCGALSEDAHRSGVEAAIERVEQECEAALREGRIAQTGQVLRALLAELDAEESGA